MDVERPPLNVVTRENGDLLRRDAGTDLFAQPIEKAAVPRIRLHDLRHTHASLAPAAGVDVELVSNSFVGRRHRLHPAHRSDGWWRGVGAGGVR